MGQIFQATVYNVEDRTCFVADADKFHANCYSFSGIVCAVHYLLRKSAYHVMWCGGYIVLNDAIKDFLSEEQLLGISITEDLKSFQNYDEDLADKVYYDKIKFIDENSKSWTRMDVWSDARKYFDFENSEREKYNGYLVNHTKKQAINLKDYYDKSVSLTKENEEYSIDLIPPLTETGGGTLMALFDGCSADVTEHLVGTWCGDLLQIVEELPENYEEISCCFASVWEKADYCKREFGLDDEQFILKNDNKERFECVRLSLNMDRGSVCNIQCKIDEDRIRYKPIPIE